MLGEVVGSYRLEGKLGEGGMGVVYSATHTVLGKLAAIKLMRPQLCADDESVARFFNEAVLTASIRHPGIVEIFDYGVHEPSGSAFISMALLEGESLEARLEARGRLPLIEALRISRQIASALAAAHQAGVVHRDLKPDNVFLTPDPDLPGGERIQLLDFGIAKLLDEEERAISLTRTGTMIGTPLYMSPEQCRGRSDLDGRTDLYALGCMLYRMLSGLPPFVGETPLEVAAAHLRDAPEPLSGRLSGLPPPVSDLVDELLAKDRDKRPESAAALQRRISSLLATLDSGVEPLETAGETIDLGRAETVATGAGPQRRRLRVWAIGGVALALVAAALWIRAAAAPDTDLSPSVELPRDCAGLDLEACRRAASVLADGTAGVIDRDRAIAMFRDACAAGSYPACADAVAVDRRLLISRSDPHFGDPQSPYTGQLIVDYADPGLAASLDRLWQRLRDRFPGKISLAVVPAPGDARAQGNARVACAAHRQKAFVTFMQMHEFSAADVWTSERIRRLAWSRDVDPERVVADFEEACEHEVDHFAAVVQDLALEPGTLLISGRPVPPPHDLDLIGYLIERQRAEAAGSREARIASAQRPVQSVIRYPIDIAGPPAPITIVTACDPAVFRCQMLSVMANAEGRASGARVAELLVALEPDRDLPARTLCAARFLGVAEPIDELLSRALHGPPVSEPALRSAVSAAGADWPAFTTARDGPCAAEVAAATRRLAAAGAPSEVTLFVNGRPSRIVGTPTQALIREELTLAKLYGYGRRIPADRYYRWLVTTAPDPP